MKTSAEVSPEKLRGGFYSSPALVQVCLDRIMMLTGDRSSLRFLEPSAGDGAFLRGLASHPLAERVRDLVGVELLESEAANCRTELGRLDVPGAVATGSYLRLRDVADEPFDAAVGNPPFLRFQFVDQDDLPAIEQLGREMGLTLRGVSNLWIPIFLGAIGQLRNGGAFAFIVPAECLTGTSALVVRSWLVRHSDLLQIDLFPPGSFPGVLQEVVVLSGRRRSDSAPDSKVEVFDHANGESWRHTVNERLSTWTGLLLPPTHLDLLLHLRDQPEVLGLREVAKISVSTVTGANDFFSYDDQTREHYGLDPWSRPLVARVRHVPGLRFNARDLDENRKSGLSAWLLDTAATDADLLASAAGRRYVSDGEDRDLHTRYKCRIRSPWYQVPVVAPGSLLLSKRSHRYPRLMINEVRAATTDTIYQGSPNESFAGRERDIVGSFHNSLTLLSAEMFGRSFGGGVLELVPSEVSALLIPLVRITEPSMRRLDALVRKVGADSEQLVEATDELVMRQVPALNSRVMDTVRDARRILLERRLARN